MARRKKAAAAAEAPTFTLSGDDYTAEPAIARLLTTATDPARIVELRKAVKAFQDFRDENPGLMK